MKKLFLFLIIPLVINAQENNYEGQELVNDLIEAYNSEDYKSVFELFSAEMKTAIPKRNLKKFLKNLNSDVGKISGNNFIRKENDVIIYKLTFEKWISQYSFFFKFDQTVFAAVCEIFWTVDARKYSTLVEGDSRSSP